jgi:16S rRNA G1207 methylase RsmC
LFFALKTKKTKLLGLNYKTHYKKGKENIVADALSRIPVTEDIMIDGNQRKLHDSYYYSSRLE